MELKTGFATAAQTASVAERRAEDDRRTYSDRRRSGGLFEVRARREHAGYDRRQGERRERNRFWPRLWRREG